MHLLGFSTVALSLASLTVAAARLQDGRMHGNMMRPAAVPMVTAPSADIPVTSRNGTVLPPYTTVYTFDQLIDHNNPSLGTFKQRFWHTWEFYEAGAAILLLMGSLLHPNVSRTIGGPIIIMTPGEANADGIFQSFGTLVEVEILIISSQGIPDTSPIGQSTAKSVNIMFYLIFVRTAVHLSKYC